ncbi:MAG: sulfotransferase [Actinomycetes bacterium]
MPSTSRPSRYAGSPGRPVFVGACPRSGTTMLRTMLNSHPELAVPHETRFLVDAWRRRARWGDLSEAHNRRRLARWVVRRKKSRVERLVDDPKQLVDRMVAAPPTLGSVLAAGFALYAEGHDKPRWGDKRPSYVMNMDAVFRMFPDAQFINVVRDPRAAVASIRKIGWYRDGLEAGAAIWEQSVRCADIWRRRLAPDQFLEIQYEKLVADPRGTLEEIVAFLGLDPAGIDPMLQFHETTDIHSATMHPLVAKPVTTEALRTWDDTLDPGEVAFIENALARPMRRYGYTPDRPGVQVPAELSSGFRDRRRRMTRQRRRTWMAERQLKLKYRRPVAAVRRDDPHPGTP